MSYGFAIRQPNGRLWCSPDVTPMIFHQKLVLKGAVRSFTTDIPSNQPIMLFYRSNGGGSERGVLFNKSSPAGGFHSYSIQDYKRQAYGKNGDNVFNVGFEVYIFTTAYSSKQNDYGLNVYDKQGRLTYSAGMRPLDLKSISRWSMREMDVYTRERQYEFGKKVAVLPTYVNLTRDEYYYSDYTEFVTRYWVSGIVGIGSYRENILYDYAEERAYGYSYELDAINYIETAIYDK